MSEDLEQDWEIFGKDQLGKDGKALKTLDVLKEIVTNDRRWKGAFHWVVAPNHQPHRGYLAWSGDPICLRRDSSQGRVSNSVTQDDLTRASYWLDRVYGKAYKEADIWKALALTAKKQAGV
jgi:hypothetical protein